MSELQSMASGESAAAQFDRVLADELEVIAKQRAEPGVGYASVLERARKMKLAGLAFSGGGIRSATFNLGFLQGLGNRRVLHGFDYLSTVSGGGYTGAWLSALLLRRNGDAPAGANDVRRLAESELASPPAASVSSPAAGLAPPEAAAVRFVRRYADYLTPRLGLSGDTLTLLSVGLRNVVVMQLLLLSLLVAAFSFLLLLAGGHWVSARSLFASPPQPLQDLFQGLGLTYAHPGHWLMLPAFCLLMLALLTAIYSQLSRPRQLPPLFITGCVLLPSLLSGVFFALALQSAAISQHPITRGGWIALPVIGYMLAWWGTLARPRAWIGMLSAAATFAVALWAGVEPLSEMLAVAPFGHAVAFAPVVAITIICTVITMHLAMAGPAIDEQEREWWARAGGQGIFLALAWTLAQVFLLYVPPLIDYSVNAAAATGTVWAILTWIGATLAKGGDTGAKGSNRWKELLTSLAPWLFVIGLLALVAWVYVALLIRPDYGQADAPQAMIDIYHGTLAQRVGAGNLVITVGSGALLLFVAFAYLVDLNIFSAHSFYRYRLARSFLGASHSTRRPNRFTGFDPNDDLALARLAGQRPIPLINANLNLTGGEELAWQTRRGASFVFTPGYCGFAMRTTSGKLIGGYRPTATYGGGLSLATAIAVSGAAASPNMGFHTSTSVAALLTVLNLRLARWCPNPEMGHWADAAPTWGAGYLFAELFGEATGRKSWINLSDGGHFDNLGLYELVRRRACLIVATDAGADEAYRFDDLAMVTRKLWTDFGVRLEIAETELAAIRPGPAPVERPGDPACSERHWAFGRIIYPDGPPACLIYVKSSLTRDLPIDIRQYKDNHPAFPHEPTADQWFDENQFEAYRHLGQIIAEQVFDRLLPEHSTMGTTLSSKELVAKMMQRMNCPAAEMQGA